MTEYKQLLQQLDQNKISKDDVYNELMAAHAASENMALNKLSEVASEELESSQNNLVFYNVPLLDLIVTIINNWSNMFTEFVIQQKFGNWKQIFWDGDRKLYLGVLIVLISFLLFFMSIS